MRKSIEFYKNSSDMSEIPMILRSLAESVDPKTVGLVRRIDESDAAVVDFEGTGGG